MRAKLLDLYEIQKIDVTIREIEKRRESVPQRLNQLDADIASDKTQLQLLTNQRDAVAREIQTLDGTVQAETDKLRKWEKRLADIRNQREYQALQREVAASKQANRTAEEQMAEHGKKRDELEQQIAVLQAKVDANTATSATEREQVTTALAAIDEELKTATARRGGLLSKVPQPLLRKYDSIRTKRLGVGLVLAVEGSCQGCNMRLPPQLYIILQRGETIEQCPSCQRLLFFDKALSVAPTAAANAEVNA